MLFYYGTDDSTEILTDERLSLLIQPERSAYKSALRAGRSFGAEHRRHLANQQREQIRKRNIHGGYWIAEACESAAYKAIASKLDQEVLNWAVIATGSVVDDIAHLNAYRWRDLARPSKHQLRRVLQELHDWE